MILNELRNAWRHDGTMHEVLQTLQTMVGDASLVLTQAWEASSGQAVPDHVGPTLRKRDKAINQAERAIRRRVIEHLSLNPGKDVSGCLAILLSAKDVERIGDHGRNIFRVADRLQGKISRFHFFPDLDAFHRDTAGLMALLQRAIAESDSTIARKILDDYIALKPKFKAFIPALYPAELPCEEAVATTLLGRYFRRIVAHIGNAASGIVFPVETIDYIALGIKDEANEAKDAPR